MSLSDDSNDVNLWMSLREYRRVPACVYLCLTIRLLWWTAAAESHDNRCKSKTSLHTVLPDALQDVEREVDMQITQEHNAVAILQEQTQTITCTVTASQSVRWSNLLLLKNFWKTYTITKWVNPACYSLISHISYFMISKNYVKWIMHPLIFMHFLRYST